jgi:hypothetical protein
VTGDPTPVDPARGRFFILSLLRVGGALMVLAGMVAASGRFASIPVVAGYALIVVGLVDMAVVPQILARRWRTPPAP